MGIQLLATGFVFFASVERINAQTRDFRLELPVDCDVGVTCFFQNFADLDPSKNIRDPWCGNASYDGHKGTDIRLLSMADIASDVPVTASASGIVKAVRDGEPDRLVATSADRETVAGKECGNGVVIAHGDGFETQYCHLKRGSVSVRPGERVNVGDPLGAIGSSGFSQFPHVHLSLRQNGKWIDPVSGKSLGDACGTVDENTTYLSKKAYARLPQDRRQLLSAGVSGDVIKHQNLVRLGAPDQANPSSENSVAWAWFINLQKGDEISLQFSGPEGEISSSRLKALEQSKASYSAFTGRKLSPSPGEYQLRIAIENRGAEVFSDTKTWAIR